jgi:hypothetical protein
VQQQHSNATAAMITIVKRVWLPVLVIVAIAVGGLAVANLRSVFGSDKAIVTPVDADTAENFNPKVVTYEIFGTGSSATINYADLDGKPQRTGEVSLPWSLTLQTTLPSVMPNIMAQGDGQSITCRVTVDDEVKDERTAQGVNAATYCLVKAA